MQDLFKYKGYSVFCYCEPGKMSNRYIVNFLIQDVDNQKPAKHTMRLAQEFKDIEVALEYAGKEAKQYIDDNDSGINYSEMKKDVE